MKIRLVDECFTCPFWSDDYQGSWFCRQDDDARAVPESGPPPAWCPLRVTAITVQLVADPKPE